MGPAPVLQQRPVEFPYILPQPPILDLSCSCTSWIARHSDLMIDEFSSGTPPGLFWPLNRGLMFPGFAALLRRRVHDEPQYQKAERNIGNQPEGRLSVEGYYEVACRGKSKKKALPFVERPPCCLLVPVRDSSPRLCAARNPFCRLLMRSRGEVCIGDICDAWSRIVRPALAGRGRSQPSTSGSTGDEDGWERGNRRTARCMQLHLRR